MAAVTFRNVDIIFGKRPKQALSLLDQGASREEILDKTGQVLGAADASIAIEEGEICVLMGLSGSGKSTLLRAVNGLNKVTRGEVLVEYNGKNIDVASCNQRTLRALRTSKIAMVFQQFALLPWRTVRDNVGLGLELKGIGKAKRNAIVDEKLKLVGLEQWADKYTHELSGGMQQRVGLARAFATDADILLMDEPFSALDPLIRDKLQDELLDLQRELKKTIIFVSHDLDEAMKIGTHIAIMEGGRIVQYGEPEEIVLNPANDYVAEFVAHMNPLHVLKAGSLMTSVDQLYKQDDEYWLDSSGDIKITLNNEGEIAQVSYREVVQITSYYDSSENLTDFLGEVKSTIVSIEPNVLMNDVIELLHKTRMPVLLQNDGKWVGVIREQEIYKGLLQH